MTQFETEKGISKKKNCSPCYNSLKSRILNDWNELQVVVVKAKNLKIFLKRVWMKDSR